MLYYGFNVANFKSKEYYLHVHVCEGLVNRGLVSYVMYDSSNFECNVLFTVHEMYYIILTYLSFV